MRPSEIQKQLKTQPFVPIRLHISDGSNYEIHHPEMLVVSERVLAVAIYGRSDRPMPESVVLCDPLHVTRVEPINGAVPEAHSSN